MMGSPSAIITMGYGTGGFGGSPSLIVTAGYGIGDEVVITVTPGRLEYTIPCGLLQYTMPNHRLEFTAREP